MSVDERPPLPGNVAGRCPACGGESLFLGAGGHVTCSWLGCPRPDAADVILGDGETCHIVRLTVEGFTLQHPLIERVNDLMMDCDLHLWLTCMDGWPPVEPGRYRMVEDTAGDWVFQPIADRIVREHGGPHG